MNTPHPVEHEHKQPGTLLKMRMFCAELKKYVYRELKTLFSLNKETLLLRELSSFGKVGYEDFDKLNLTLESHLAEISPQLYMQFRIMKRKHLSEHLDGKLYLCLAEKKQSYEMSSMITLYGSFLEYLSTVSCEEAIKKRMMDCMKYYTTEPIPSWRMSVRELLNKHGFVL